MKMFSENFYVILLLVIVSSTFVGFFAADATTGGVLTKSLSVGLDPGNAGRQIDSGNTGCIDSGNGKVVYNGAIYSNRCASTASAVVYYCSENKMKTKTTRCTSGKLCVDGSCVVVNSKGSGAISQACQETDNGLDYDNAGTVTYRNRDYEDKCTLFIASKPFRVVKKAVGLRERYCENGKLKTKYYDCSLEGKVCTNDRCVGSETGNNMETDKVGEECIEGWLEGEFRCSNDKVMGVYRLADCSTESRKYTDCGTCGCSTGEDCNVCMCKNGEERICQMKAYAWNGALIVGPGKEKCVDGEWQRCVDVDNILSGRMPTYECEEGFIAGPARCLGKDIQGSYRNSDCTYKWKTIEASDVAFQRTETGERSLGQINNQIQTSCSDMCLSGGCVTLSTVVR